ncbi:MAG: shikimate dehydrogenase, partial [Firmicutes bacterium]|nr:shikimate dehydrogenase [Bacillota bacterium]
MKVYAVIGTPLQHSLSPLLHNSLLEAWDLPYVYIPWEIFP